MYIYSVGRTGIKVKVKLKKKEKSYIHLVVVIVVVGPASASTSDTIFTVLGLALASGEFFAGAEFPVGFLYHCELVVFVLIVLIILDIIGSSVVSKRQKN